MDLTSSVSSNSFHQALRRQHSGTAIAASKGHHLGAATSTSHDFSHDSGCSPIGRNSRHIPAREDMDMDLASFALTSNCDGSFANSSNNSLVSSFTEVDDSDHTHKTSMYRGFLAERLLDRSLEEEGLLKFGSGGGGGGAGRSATGAANGSIAASGALRPHGALQSVPVANAMMGAVGSRGVVSKSTTAPRKGTTTMSKPDKILDAPELPAHDSQFLSWDAAGSILIGLRSVLYKYDWNTQSASRVEDFLETEVINCVAWINHHACAVNLCSGPTVIYDVEHASNIRTIDPPHGTISCIAPNAHMVAAGSRGPRGSVFLFDLRARNALAYTHEGGQGAVHALDYGISEPRYLASGGDDCCVRVWDGRRADTPHYRMESAHLKPVTAVKWCPNKRSLLMSGGADGRLRLFNTHKPPRTNGNIPTDAHAFSERTVQTSAPISALLWPDGSRHIATCHTNGVISRRGIDKLMTEASFCQPGIEAGVACAAIAPDLRTVCSAQHDEQLKFWSVFERPATPTVERRGSGSALDELVDDVLR